MKGASRNIPSFFNLHNTRRYMRVHTRVGTTLTCGMKGTRKEHARNEKIALPSTCQYLSWYSAQNEQTLRRWARHAMLAVVVGAILAAML